MNDQARSEATTAKPFTASVDECAKVRSGVMRAGMARAQAGADPIELQAWLTMLEIACRLTDEAQARDAR